MLRFGANDDERGRAAALARARGGPAAGRGPARGGGLDLRALMAQALRMGDEMHQRNVAASALLARALMPHLARVGRATPRRWRGWPSSSPATTSSSSTSRMAAGKAMADPASGSPAPRMVATMARNGTEFGIRVAGLGDALVHGAGRRRPSGLYFPGFGADDANPDMGDSAIVETIGLGGFAMAASPAVARFVGAGGLADAVAITEEMREISPRRASALPHPDARRARHARRDRRAASGRDRHHAR